MLTLWENHALLVLWINEFKQIKIRIIAGGRIEVGAMKLETLTGSFYEVHLSKQI